MNHVPAIDIFSPLPPLPTDIGNHTVGVLDALQHMARVRVWTSQDGPVHLDMPGVEIRRFRPETITAADLNQADATFYNLGNNARFHRDIHNVARRIPGIVILHDTHLQHFFAAYSERPGEDRVYYLDQLERSHGPAMRAWGEEFIEGRRDLQDLVDAATMTLAAVEGAVGAVLHNEEDGAALASKTHVPVYLQQLSFRYGPVSAKLPTPALALPATVRSRLIMFGYIGKNRRLLQILEALASMPDQDLYWLDIYGLVEDEQEIDAAITAAGLNSIVTRHGFVPEADLDRALESADLAFNLRWPSMGEASGSQLRLWAAQCPALVTKVGWYAHLPPDTVFMIDQADEHQQIVHHLRALRQTPSHYAQVGARGRRVLEQHHSPTAYAQGLVEIASDHVAQHARCMGHTLALRAARSMLDIGTKELALPMGAELGRRIAELTGC
jgi:glycosyltransferase involved in cell wall biosynthesis